jgi:diaminopimelate epimerase
MQGCGNDFLFLDYMREDDAPRWGKSEVKFLCDRHFGVGADGLVVLTKSRVAHASWVFYNSDGSVAEMCGNAARCAIKWLSERYFPKEELITLETQIGIIKGKYLGDNISEVSLSPHGNPTFEYEERVIKVDEEAYRVCVIDTGVPHAVIEVDDIRKFPIAKVGKAIQKHALFQPEETNVTFYQKLVGPQVLSTTYERGVEQETFACGTGAAAAAIIYSQSYLQSFPIQVYVPGGEIQVDLSPAARVLLLRGPAHRVAEFELDDIPTSYEPLKLYGAKS